MGLMKCPRCELNYILDTEKICSVCKREVRGEPEQDDLLEMCSECGEHPAMPGQELCMYCLKDLQHRSAVAVADDGIAIAPGDAVDIDSVSTMDEIALDLPDDDMSDTPFPAEEGEAFDDEEDEDDEDDLSIDEVDEDLDEEDDEE